MNEVIKAHLERFVSQLGFGDSLEESVKFEHFAAFSILTPKVNSSLLKHDLEAVSTQKSQGVDSIAFLVNGRLVTCSEEKDNFEGHNLGIDVYFVQSKGSHSFSNAEFSTFLDIVIDFFADTPNYQISTFENARDIYERFFLDGIREQRSVKMNIHCLYVALCQDPPESILNATKKAKQTILKKTGYFDEISITLIDESTLLKMHKKAFSPLKASFTFKNRTQLDDIQNVEEAYIGFIPFSEFKKLIIDEEQAKIKSLFNDNLRDFLGFDDNPINLGIKKTLENKKFNEFSLLNNGITVIADSNEGKGNTLTLINYQIVNGCQTSNVLFECKNIPNIDSVLIPLKVIITQDEKLRDEIILTTNSQSKFTEQQLFAITQFQKTLEDFYTSQRKNDGLYYERRTRQYANLNLKGKQVIEIKEQLKSFAAMFLEHPHVVAGNIGQVVKKYKDDFFQPRHDPLPYYVAGLLSNKWGILQTIDSFKKFNKFRYHIFMGLRILAEEVPFKRDYLYTPRKYKKKNSKNGKNGFERLLVIIRDDKKLKKLLDKTIAIFEQIPKDNSLKHVYSGPITEKFKELLKQSNDVPNPKTKNTN